MKEPLRERTHRKPMGVLVWGKDLPDVLQKATEMQGKFRVHGQRLAVEKAKYHSDIVYLDGKYKQYEIPIVPMHKGINSVEINRKKYERRVR